MIKLIKHFSTVIAIAALCGCAFAQSGGVSSSKGAPHFVDDELLTGSINGSNLTFTTAHAPNPTTSLVLYIFCTGVLNVIPNASSSQRISQAVGGGAPFTVSGTTVTFSGGGNGVAPATNAYESGCTMLGSYRY
jgi:hypothetical protein